MVPAHTARIMTEFSAKKGIKLVPHAPYTPDLAPADFWLFPKIMANLALESLIKEDSTRNVWEQLDYTIPTDEFRAMWDKGKMRNEKRIGREYVKKIGIKYIFSKLLTFCVIEPFALLLKQPTYE